MRSGFSQASEFASASAPRWVRQQPRRSLFDRSRSAVRRWLRALREPEPPGPHAELWQGSQRKTYLVPYESSWRALAPGEASGWETHGEGSRAA